MAAALPNRIPNDGARHRSEPIGSNDVAQGDLAKTDLGKIDPRERLIVALDVSSAAAAQKIVAAVTPVTAGSSQTYTWTLPANFPTGKVLRVKVDGGTLTQGGTALTWSEHGYYEVSLYAGSLTLSP